MSNFSSKLSFAALSASTSNANIAADASTHTASKSQAPRVATFRSHRFQHTSAAANLAGNGLRHQVTHSQVPTPGPSMNSGTNTVGDQPPVGTLANALRARGLSSFVKPRYNSNTASKPGPGPGQLSIRASTQTQAQAQAQTVPQPVSTASFKLDWQPKQQQRSNPFYSIAVRVYLVCCLQLNRHRNMFSTTLP
jgi:hypothetical protein